MPLDQFATQIEPKPCSRNLAGPRILRSHKAPEDAGMLAGRNAHAPIVDGKQHDV